MTFNPYGFEEDPLLTDDEQRVIELMTEVYDIITNKILPQNADENVEDNALVDRLELLSHVNIIQRFMMSQAGARSYPRYRLLGK